MNDIIAILSRDGLFDEKAVSHVRDALAEGKPLDEALRASSNGNGTPGVPEEKLLRTLADYFHVQFVDLENANPPKELLSRFPVRVLLAHGLLPWREEPDGSVLIVTSKIFDTTGLDELRLSSGIEVRPALAPAGEIDRACKRLLGVGADTLQSMGVNDDDVMVIETDDEDLDLTSATAAAQDASIIRFVNQVMAEALELRATDVHVEPFEAQLRVRYRVDGVLQEANIPAQVRKFHAAIVSRLKILSHLDIAEKRVPQDGRIRLKVAGREIDLRVSVIPMIHGEAVVLRILDRGDAILGLEHLGFAKRDARAWEEVIQLPHGIILVTGPTGSGKTTTLYAALSKINTVDQKIITIEDPVEYQLRGINQIQVNTKANLTFGAGLRAILRHDPDVILIGEIRDRETADIAVQSSLTGHLVFSTLHTNDAPGAITRLIEMGIEPYLVASTVEMIVAQRLVRVICKQCKEVAPPADLEAMASTGITNLPEVVYRGKGCRNCLGTGYRGRQGVFELMPVTEEIRELTLERVSAGKIREVAMRQGMNSLRGDGWRLVGEGRTTVEEVMRLTKDESAVAGASAMGINM